MKTTCLIPFYNENKRILRVLEVVSKIKEFDQIICIDDGSEDNSSNLIKQKYPKIKLIKLKKNKGKAEAIKQGLKHLKTKYTFLIDADLRNLEKEPIKQAIKLINSSPKTAMIILKRIKAPIFSKITRAHILFSGERILQTSDLKKVFQLKPRGFQVEAAINQYFMEKGLNPYFIPSKAINTYAHQKTDIISGSLKLIKMFNSIFKLVGFRNYFKQTLFFGRKKPTCLNFSLF